MQTYLLRITAAGAAEPVCIHTQPVPAETLAALLHTDVTERMRIPVMPEALAGERVLCYFIDARGGDRGLPANFLGTCFYHTGCPVFGDLLIAFCEQDSRSETVSGFTEAELQVLQSWLKAQFAAYLEP